MGNGTGRANKSNYEITKEKNLWVFVVYCVIIRRQFKRKLVIADTVLAVLDMLHWLQKGCLVIRQW